MNLKLDTTLISVSRFPSTDSFLIRMHGASSSIDLSYVRAYLILIEVYDLQVGEIFEVDERSQPSV